MIKILFKSSALLLGIAIIFVNLPNNNSNELVNNEIINKETELELCVKKGIAYFKEIESYPKLSTGRDAEVVAIERCKRSTHAFP